MPKLSHEVIEQKRDHIEEAARELFIRQGFHATSMRDIAAQAGVSLGNLYNYYRTKEEILDSIINKYQQVIDQRLKAMFDDIDEPLLPENLIKFGQRVKGIVNDHHDYWLLMYIDVLEFQNQHFRKMFENLVPNLQRRFKGYFSDVKTRQMVHEGIDPAFGYAAIYMQYFNYFLVERLFGGNHHLGMSDDQAIAKLAEVFSRGLLKSDQPGRPQN